MKLATLLTAAMLQACSTTSPVEPLATIEIRYVEDGAADATITEEPDPRTQAIVDRGAEALPLLAGCLTSTAATRAVAVTGSGSTPVPLGYVCLDLLMAITEGDAAHVRDCADDGLGACMHEEFYFRPDVYATNPADAARQVAAVQRAWQHAIGDGKVRFAYPAWWDSRR